MPVRKVCILGLCCKGVPLSAVIALKCPEIRVYVVHKNSEFVYSVNTGRIPPEISVPGLEDLIRKSHNKNLIFTTNEKNAIKEAEIIFIMSNSKMKTLGEGKSEIVDMSVIKDAALQIAENAENYKIVVENSSIPIKTAECVRHILNRYGKPRVEFDVVSNPEFYFPGSSLRNLLSPGFVLIGNENTPKGLSAAKVVASIYERWIPTENIIIREMWSIEMTKIATYAMMARSYANLQALAAICEEVGGDLSVCRDIVGGEKSMGTGIFESCFNVGKLPQAVRNLVYLYDSYNHTQEADYWRGVLEIFSFSKLRFFKNVISKLNGTVTGRRITLLGFAYFKDSEVIEGSTALDLCSWLLDEGAFVHVYHPKISKQHAIEAVVNSGLEKPVEEVERLLTMFDDPYKALKGSEAFILGCSWPDFMELDFERIYKDMKQPAHVFDTAEILPHAELQKIGFQVWANGKYIEKRV